MKPATKNNPRPLWDLTREVAPGFIRLSRRGKPLAYVLLASHYDEEDIGYMLDEDFWKLINERSKGPFVPWDQVKAELVTPEPSTRGATKSNGRKKGKRNAAA